MTISTLQFDVQWLNLDKNLETVERFCADHISTDLIVLPEMFNTGYVMNTNLLEVEWQEKTISELQYLAEKYNTIISGSIPFFKNDKWFNTFIFVNHSGLIGSYDKIHLFTPAGEKESYTQGKSLETVYINGVSIQPLICYDLRFPYINSLADVVIYSANWPKARIDHWNTLIKARAIENQCYAMGVNRTGIDNNNYEYPGQSCAYGYDGTEIFLLHKDKDSATLNVNKDALSDYRKRLPFSNDRIDISGLTRIMH